MFWGKSEVDWVSQHPGGHGVKETTADPVVGLLTASSPPFIRMGQSGAKSSLGSSLPSEMAAGSLGLIYFKDPLGDQVLTLHTHLA